MRLSPTWIGRAPVGGLSGRVESGTRQLQPAADRVIPLLLWVCFGGGADRQAKTTRCAARVCGMARCMNMCVCECVSVCIADLMSRLRVGCVKSQQASAQRGREKERGAE